MNMTLKEKILRRDKYTCRFCGARNRLTIDHILPLSRGGHPTKKANLVTACTPCNQRKANRTPEEAGMAIISEGFDYTPTGRMDDQVATLTSLPHVARSRRKDKRRIRVERKKLIRDLYDSGILKK
jgi:hypothetical protein